MLLVISMAFGSVPGSQTPAADPAVRPVGLRQIIPSISTRSCMHSPDGEKWFSGESIES